MLNIDFFFRACLSTLELLKRHEFVKKGVVEVEGFFKFVALYAGGEYTFNVLRSARGVTRDEWKRISLYGTTKFEDIRAEWFMDDISEFRGNDLLLAMIIFGDLLVHPECADDYVNCPDKLHNFTEICEFKLDYIITMRSILNTFLEEMKHAQRKLPEKQEKFWAYTSEEERIVYSVEARKVGIPVNTLIQLKQLQADQAAREEREKENKRKRQRTRIVVVILAVIIGLGLWVYQTGLTDSNSSTKKTTSVTTQNTQLTPVSTYNGKIIIATEYVETCPFTVIADSNADYYIYLDYQRAPTYSAEGRKAKSTAKLPYESDIAFIVKAGKQVSIDVPIGIYKLYYATGTTFYGSKELFGSKTSCYEADELLSFYLSGNYYNGHTITLKSTYNGNFDTDKISESSFPKR